MADNRLADPVAREIARLARWATEEAGVPAPERDRTAEVLAQHLHRHLPGTLAGADHLRESEQAAALVFLAARATWEALPDPSHPLAAPAAAAVRVASERLSPGARAALQAAGVTTGELTGMMDAVEGGAHRAGPRRRRRNRPLRAGGSPGASTPPEPSGPGA